MEDGRQCVVQSFLTCCQDNNLLIMIVDNELVGVGAVADDEEFPHYPSIPMGRRIGQMLWNNFEKYGDTLWMVRRM